VSVLKASESELKAALGADDVWKAAEAALRCGPSIVIVTRGVKGAYLLLGKNRYEIPACRPRVIVDPTGAGDAFIGAFMAEYARQKDPLWCAAVGSAASSFLVEGPGVSYFGSKKGIVERAQQAYQKVRKLG
jgi:sugar/nucleoside kinase (ribokinase family)